MLQLILVIGLGLAALVLWLPALSEAFCVIRARARSQTRGSATLDFPRLLILVPAHDEELLIERCVQSLITMNYPAASRRIVVVADNCSDQTATIARDAGAECLERTDTTLKGKPRAIAWALTHFNLLQFDACVVVDADSVVEPDFALGIAKLVPLNDIVFQANIAVVNEFDGWLTRLGGLLSRVRYDITYPLKQAAGLNCPIMGNGMGFGSNVLLRDGWRSFSITEDSELYAIYTVDGVTIRLAHDATLFAQEESRLNQGVTQRRRWLGGRMRAIGVWGGPILRSKRIGWHQKLDTLIELGLASPVIHLILASFVALLAFLLLPSASAKWIAIVSLSSLSGLVIMTVVAIWRHPEPGKTVLSFFMLPVYAAWRSVVLLTTLVTLHDTTWRRTARSAPSLPVANLRS